MADFAHGVGWCPVMAEVGPVLPPWANRRRSAMLMMAAMSAVALAGGSFG